MGVSYLGHPLVVHLVSCDAEGMHSRGAYTGVFSTFLEGGGTPTSGTETFSWVFLWFFLSYLGRHRFFIHQGSRSFNFKVLHQGGPFDVFFIRDFVRASSGTNGL